MDVLNFTFLNHQALILGEALKGVVYRVQRNVLMLRKKQQQHYFNIFYLCYTTVSVLFKTVS